MQALPFVWAAGLGMSTIPHIFRPNWAFLRVVSEVSSRSASSFVTERTGVGATEQSIAAGACWDILPCRSTAIVAFPLSLMEQG